MSHDDQRRAHGHLAALRNKGFDPHGAYPHFSGALTLPDGQARQTSLWARNSDNGRSFILGRVHPPVHTMMDRLANGENASAAKAKLTEIPQDYEALDPKPGELIALQYECTGCGIHHYKGYYNPGNGNAYAISLDTHVQVDGEISLSADVVPCDVVEMTTWQLRTDAQPPAGDDDDEDDRPAKKRSMRR